MVDTLRVSERHACRVIGQHRSTQRRPAPANRYRDRLVARMRRLAQSNPRRGRKHILDRSAIRGVPAGVVPTITPRPGAPLVISCCWTALHEHWQRGTNCGWQSLYHGAPETLVAIDRHAERIGASEVIFDSDRLRESPLREIFIDLRASLKARHLRRKVK